MHKTPIAIVAALDDELSSLRAKMLVDESIYRDAALLIRGRLFNQPAVVLRSGIGVPAMQQALELCFKEIAPQCVLHIGYCGGADPSLVVGDIVIATRVVDAATDQTYATSENLVAKARDVCKQRELRSWAGGVTTVGEFLQDPHEKAFVGTRYDAIAVDMESAALAKACVMRDTPALVIRAVFDPLDMHVPDLSSVLDEAGNPEPLALAYRLITRPKELLHIPRLHYSACQARNSLSSFVEGWLVPPNTGE